MNDQGGDPAWLLALKANLEADPDPAARYVQMATVRHPSAACRMVVFRGFDGPEPAILFTTDRRSRKVAELAAEPVAEVCWYFRLSREQFRISGPVEIVAERHGATLAPHRAELRRRVWQVLGQPARKTFFGPPPGVPLEEVRGAWEAPGDLSEPAPDFAVLRLCASQVDHLDLKPDPHRRMRHRKVGGWTSTELTP